MFPPVVRVDHGDFTLADDAPVYLKEVRTRFKENSNSTKYDEFVTLLTDNKAQKICLGELVTRVKDLFEDQKDLFVRFLKFVPEAWKIIPPAAGYTPHENSHKRRKLNVGDPLSQQAINCTQLQHLLRKGRMTYNFDAAFRYVTKVKSNFPNEMHIYNTFANLILMQRDEKISLDATRQILESLFQQHPDFMAEFDGFFRTKDITAESWIISFAEAVERLSTEERLQDGRLPHGSFSPAFEF